MNARQVSTAAADFAAGNRHTERVTVQFRKRSAGLPDKKRLALVGGLGNGSSRDAAAWPRSSFSTQIHSPNSMMQQHGARSGPLILRRNGFTSFAMVDLLQPGMWQLQMMKLSA